MAAADESRGLKIGVAALIPLTVILTVTSFERLTELTEKLALLTT
jgi:hypothetical protein